MNEIPNKKNHFEICKSFGGFQNILVNLRNMYPALCLHDEGILRTLKSYLINHCYKRPGILPQVFLWRSNIQLKEKEAKISVKFICRPKT